MKILSALSVLALFLAAFTACDKSPAPVKESPAATPRDAYVQLLTALRDGDEAGALSKCRITAKQLPAVRAAFSMAAASAAFRDDFIKAYGAAAWDDFQDKNKKPADGNTSLNLATDEDINKARSEPIKINGDEATAVAGDGTVIKIVKVAGGWLVDASFAVPDENHADEMAKTFSAFSATITQYRRAIGKPGIKPEDIDAELGRDLMEAAHRPLHIRPHRFDINTIK